MANIAVIAGKRGHATATDDDRREAQTRLKTQALAATKQRAAGRAEAIDKLLSSTDSALLLAQWVGQGHVSASARPQVLAAAMAKPGPQVRDLFERFVPDEQRVKRLGSVIKPQQILALKGDAERGRELFFKSGALQCVNCHNINGTGRAFGPDLSQIGKQYSRTQILESLLEPSKSIDPKYVAYVVETTDGKIHSGLLRAKTDKEVVLKLQEKEERIPTGKVERLAPQSKSLMPELLLRELTAQQAADLLEFLSLLK
jgi:putative heme-binding domain-containing protein